MEETRLKTHEQGPNSFIFKLGDAEEPVIVINQQGFWHKGDLIKDSGEVYRLFKQFIEGEGGKS
jgi:hypothetical protein